ncbi:MAG: hypothetical protein QNJ22_04060 [Desulfosarcinaceae bacterium]|nr:hypothetical protein [Desulfosarcinaceae bacterium]
MSGDGQVVYGTTSYLGFGSDIFTWSAADGTEYIGCSLGAFECYPGDTSADGAVLVGWWSEEGYGLDDSAFRWTAEGGFEDLGYLRFAEPPGEHDSVVTVANGVSADGRVVVGGSGYGTYSQAFRWTASLGMQALPSPHRGLNSWGRAVSADGRVVAGECDLPTGGREACRWTRLGVEGLGDLPGGDVHSMALAVSGDGAVVVGSGETDDGTEAFIWMDGKLFNLKDYLVTQLGLSISGWTLTRAMDISPDGTFSVGYGINPSGDAEAWLAYIGEEPYLWPRLLPTLRPAKGLRLLP